MTVAANKTNLIFQGQGYLNTIIAWNDTANSTGGTARSSSVAIFAPYFTAYNISFQVKKMELFDMFPMWDFNNLGNIFCFFLLRRTQLRHQVLEELEHRLWH